MAVRYIHIPSDNWAYYYLFRFVSHSSPKLYSHFLFAFDNDFLDKKNAPDNYGYCVFGEVTNGIDIVEKIGESQTGRNGMYDDVPMETVLIEKVEIIKE